MRWQIGGCLEKSRRYTRGWGSEERCKSPIRLPTGKTGKRSQKQELSQTGKSLEDHRIGENAQSTSSVLCFSPVKVVLEASNSLQRAEVVVKLSSVFLGGQSLCSPCQHHLSLAAAYLAGGEVHRELQDDRKQERKGFQSRQVVPCSGRENKRQGGDALPPQHGRTALGRRQEVWSPLPPNQKTSPTQGWK